MELIITIEPSDSLSSDTFNLTSNFGTVVPATATYSELRSGLQITVDDSTYFVIVSPDGSCTAELGLYVPDAELFKVDNVYSSITPSYLCSSEGVLVTNMYSTVENDTLRAGATYFYDTGYKYQSSYYFASPQGLGQSYGQFTDGVYSITDTCDVTPPPTTPPIVQTYVCEDSVVVDFDYNLPGKENQFALSLTLPAASIGEHTFFIKFTAHNSYGYTVEGINGTIVIGDGEIIGTSTTTTGLYQEYGELWTISEQKIVNISPTDQYILEDC